MDGFLEVIRDTLRKTVWPNHGEVQGDMAADYPQGIGEKRRLHIHASMEQFAMAKGGESKTEGVQVSSQEVHIKDNNKDTSHIYKMMVRGKEASGREIEDCYEEGEHCDSGQGICNNKRARTLEDDNEISRSATKSKGTMGCVLPKCFQII